jgi:Rv2525c-like, glycoside hydrolase-like domain
MKIAGAILCLFLLLCLVAAQKSSHKQSTARTPKVWLGLDRNEYPGDDQLAALRKTLSFTSYWLNNPPGSTKNTWQGKRAVIESAGFGFVVVFNGKIAPELVHDPAKLGAQDGTSAVEAARSEGFRKGTVIFLDQEEGGRLLPTQKAYLYAWVDAVNAAGFRAGVYCSGIPFKEGDGTIIVTADDIRNNARGRRIAFWVAADACPPSPGCAFASDAPRPGASGVQFANVWQYAQSPRRPQYTSACRQTYDADGNCYPPKLSQRIHVDLNTALSPDPSHGRTR